MKNTLLLLLVMMFSQAVWADVDAEVTLLSEYRERGVSWTDGKPALQAELTYSTESGFYLGSWATNVDFGDDDKTRLEWLAFVGYEYELSEHIGLTAEAGSYFYFGGHDAKDGNYQEYRLAARFYQDTELAVAYSPDYFGADFKNYSVALSQDFAVAEQYNLNVTVSRTESIDERSWDAERDYFFAAEASLDRDWLGFNFELSASTTSINTQGEDGKSALILGVSKAWSW